MEHAKNHQNDDYYFIGANCKDLARGALANGGIYTTDRARPNDWFNNLTKTYFGQIYSMKDSNK